MRRDAAFDKPARARTYAAFLGGITMLVLVGIVYFGLRTRRKFSPRAETR